MRTKGIIVTYAMVIFGSLLISALYYPFSSIREWFDIFSPIFSMLALPPLIYQIGLIYLLNKGLPKDEAGIAKVQKDIEKEYAYREKREQQMP